MSKLKNLIDGMCDLHLALGTLCTLRSILANMKVCDTMLSSIFKAEEVLANEIVRLYDELEKELNINESGKIKEETKGAGEKQ